MPDLGGAQKADTAGIGFGGRFNRLKRFRRIFDRETYWGSVLFNLVAALLPALYLTLSKLWVARIDQSHLVTTSLYTYLGQISEILNDGLPRVAWLVIGDGTTRTKFSRLELACTLISVQACFGLILTSIFIGAAPFFAKSFMPSDIWISSVRYVRISAPMAFCDLVIQATAASTRALDQPDVSVMINVISSLANIILDLLIISNLHLSQITPSIHLQAGIRLACNFLGALAGLCWFAWNIRRLRKRGEAGNVRLWPSWAALKVLFRPAWWMFLESLTRNAIYLWVVAQIATLGNAYATACSLFESIVRWGLIMVPASAFYNSSLTFVGHNWAEWRGRGHSGPEEPYPEANWEDIKDIIRPAIYSIIGAFTVELGLCILFTLGGVRQYAYFISNSEEVTEIICILWRNVEWCYLIFAIGWQASSILLATVPKWFFFAELTSNVGWMLPWAAVLTTSHLAPADAWRLVTICLGGAVVVGSLSVVLYLMVWCWCLSRRKLYVTPVSANLRPAGLQQEQQQEEQGNSS